ncbi:MAG: hypothetical protein AB2803_03800 [Candidatus Thiodiazotropha sp.]
MSQTNQAADFAALEASDAELQAVIGPVPPGADSSSSVVALDDGLSVAPSDADLDYAWRGDVYGLSASAGPQDLYTIGQVSNEGPRVLAENQASMNDYWLSAQDNAVDQGNPIKYVGAGLMRSLGNIGYGIAEMGVGLWENPGSGGTGAAKAFANFGPETFNFGVNTLKTVLDGYTLLAETAGLQEGSLQSFRESDPYNITPLFSYDSPAESGGALLSGLVSGAAYTKLSRLRVGANKDFSISVRDGSNGRDVDWFDLNKVVNDMSSSSIGRTVLDAADSNQMRLQFSRSYYREGLLGPENFSFEGVTFSPSFGQKSAIKAKVFLPSVGSNARAAEVGIHEGVHALGVSGSKRAEVLARASEVMHRTGSSTLSLSELKKIYRQVNTTPFYNKLPSKLGEQSWLFPGVTF